jgi:hypothetical protein
LTSRFKHIWLVIGLEPGAEQLLVQRMEQPGVRDKQHVAPGEFG